MTPEHQAQLDWATLGEFRPDRKRYKDEASRITKQWDNQEN